MDLKIRILSLNSLNYSRSASVMRNLVDQGVGDFYQLTTNWKKTIAAIYSMKLTEKNDVYLVCSGSNVLAIILGMLRMHPIILDAGWATSEASALRKVGRIRRFKDILIDIFSFYFADVIFVESIIEAEYLAIKYRVPLRKFEVSYTGFTLDMFNSHNKVDKDLQEAIEVRSLLPERYCLFRGKNVSEAGLELLAKTSWLVPTKIKFVVVTNQSKELNFNPDNTLLFEKYLQTETLEMLYANCRFAFGHLGAEERNKRTIPHKIFEAAFFSKVSITSFSLAVQEIFKQSESIIMFTDNSPENLAELVIEAWENDSKIQMMGRKANEEFNFKCSEDSLTGAMLNRISQLFIETS